MIWLTKKQLIYLHRELIKATGGLDGLRDDSLLQSALLSPLQSYDEVEMFPTLIDKAVRLACGLTLNHPFVDGNKRIGAHAMLVVLTLNGITLVYEQQELAEVFLQLASGQIDFKKLKDWVYSHLRKEEQ